VRFPYQDDSDVEFGFAEAARRLAATFSAQPIDDVILLPFLFLWRHAIELSLKVQIRYAARLRRLNGDDEDKLGAEAVGARLIKTHRIGQLARELAEHFANLDLPAMPQETKRTLDWLVAADPNGLAFRYSGELPDTQDFIDFAQLSKSLEETYNMVSLGLDVLSAYGESQDEFLAIQQEQRAEFEAEMRAEYETEMRQHMDYEYSLLTFFGIRAGRTQAAGPLTGHFRGSVRRSDETCGDTAPSCTTIGIHYF